MPREPQGSPIIELKDEVPSSEGVSFDPEGVTLEGKYTDELSAFRARRGWTETLETNSLLDPSYDVVMKVAQAAEKTQFVLRCEFVSACARYAFWRLTNNQAPEAQYQIETAHIPDCESRHEEFIAAPDMRSVYDDSEPFILRGLGNWKANRSPLKRLMELIGKIVPK